MVVLLATIYSVRLGLQSHINRLRTQRRERFRKEIRRKIVDYPLDTCKDSAQATDYCLPKDHESRSMSSSSIGDNDEEVAAIMMKDELGVFQESVRKEWIDATFSRDFFPDSCDATHAAYYDTPRQGVGLSGIASFVAYTSTVPPPPPDNTDKLGLTLSRIPVGLYCRKVEPHSEAHHAGVLEGSVLISINGMGFLGEPTRQALERIWQYEGHFQTKSNHRPMSDPTKENSTPADMEYNGTSGTVHTDIFSSSLLATSGPIALRLIKDGRLYTAMLFTKGPFGISWAPCGNFALVQRSYSFAQAAGVRRGCIVAAVNGKSFRDLDHEGIALALKDAFAAGQQEGITVTLAYTPAASRTGHHDRSNIKSGSSEKSVGSFKGTPLKAARQDGVEVRIHNLEYSIGTLLACGTSRMPEPSTMSRKSRIGGVAELAARVAAGEILAPTGLKKRSGTAGIKGSDPTYQACPTLPKDAIISQWNALESLLYCEQFHLAGYSEVSFEELDSEVMSGSEKDLILHTPQANMKLFRTASTMTGAEKMIAAFLLQLVTLISSPLDLKSDETADEKSDAQKAAVLQSTQSMAEEIGKVIVDISLNTEEMSQRLYFLLGSFISTTNGKAGSAIGKVLQSAQRHLLFKLQDQASQRPKAHMNGYSQSTFDSAGNVDLQMSPSSVSSRVDDADMNGGSQIEGNGVHIEGIVEGKPKKKGSKIKRMFRKKSSNGDSSKSTLSGANSTTYTNGSASVPIITNSPTKITSPRKIVMSPRLLRRSKDSKHRSNGNGSTQNLSPFIPMPALLNNMSNFLGQLSLICSSIEKSLLLKSLTQKITDWALQPWSTTKQNALANATGEMREQLRRITADAKNDNGKTALPVMNPIESTELLVSVDPDESYILPSAHFPLLLCFKMNHRRNPLSFYDGSLTVKPRIIESEEKLYRTKVEIISLRSTSPDASKNKKSNVSYVVHGAVAGLVLASDKSTIISETSDPTLHKWTKGNVLTFDSRSSWGNPKAMALRLSSLSVTGDGSDQAVHSDEKGRVQYSSEVGYCFVDLGPIWGHQPKSLIEEITSETIHAQILSFDNGEQFDQHGMLVQDVCPVPQALELELKVTTQMFSFDTESNGGFEAKRMLLYKHDDDLRQEMLAIQYVETCDQLLKASGLDLKLLTFRCLPVGANKGFIEWVPGSVSLSEICQPLGIGSKGRKKSHVPVEVDLPDSSDGASDDQSNSDSSATSNRPTGWCKYESLRSMRQRSKSTTSSSESFTNNPIQDFLRNAAYDQDAPYFIRKEVMDAYVKSCAGYCVITYLLGVGDRHLDNLLLHPTGHFLHCDFSFILGHDPKTYLPVRITKDMVRGMGGKESDNYAMFLSLAGASFLTLRRHENLRVLMSLIRLAGPANLPDVSVYQTPDAAATSMLQRFRLDLTDDDAITYIEGLIETSISSKLWRAVDAIHKIGKRF